MTILRKRYMCGPGTIKKLLVRNGVEVRDYAAAARLYTDQQIDETVDLYISGLTAKAAGEIHGVSEPSVLRWLKDRGIKTRQVDHGGNDRYFEVLDTDEKCYWFGFMCADGRAKYKYLVINLGLKDKDHLELFKSHTGYNGPVREVTRFHKKRKKWQTYAQLIWGSVEMLVDLQHHGLLLIKSGDFAPLVVLNDSQFRSFLRGYFDGDGCLTYSRTRKSWVWYICGPHRIILEYMLSRCPVVKRYNAVWCTTAWRVVYYGNLVTKPICEWLYNGATVKLPRKYERAITAMGR